MDSGKFHSVDLRKYICPVPGIKVLVVDSNLTFLETVSKLLRKLGYEVVTASLASEALSIVEAMKNELHLALVEVQLPDLEINVLTEKIREISDLPYFLMTADDNLFHTSRELCNGSQLLLKKPITISDLSSLWNYVIWKREDGKIATREHNLRSEKRTGQYLKIGGEQSESLVLKRKRLSWTDNSRKVVMGAVELAGITAPPNQRHQHMNVPEFTGEDLFPQIFDKFFKQANPTQQHGDIHSSDLNLGSQHVLQTDNDKRHKPPNRQMYLCNCMYLHSQRTPLAACLFSSSSNPTSTFGQNQLYLSWDPLGFAYYTSAFGGFMNNSKGESSADSSQVEKVFKEDACDYCVDDLADQNEMDFSTLLANGMCQNFPPLLPVPLLPSDEKKGANFGDEGQQIDEVFYPPNGTQRFSDEDLKIWLSRVNPS